MFFFWLILTIVSFGVGIFFMLEFPGVVFKQRFFYKKIKDIVIVIGVIISIILTIVSIVIAFYFADDDSINGLWRYPICGCLFSFGVIYILRTFSAMAQVNNAKYAKSNIFFHIFKEIFAYIVVTVSAAFLIDNIFIKIAVIAVGGLSAGIRTLFIVKRYKKSLAQTTQTE